MSTAVHIPTREEIMAKVRQAMPTMHLYNPAPKWVCLPHGGRDFWFPPDLGGKTVVHPALKNKDGSPIEVSANGILGVNDQYGYRKYVKQGTEMVGQDYGVLDGQTASDIVLFFTINYATRGIIYVESNDGDDERKADSKAAYYAERKNWALGQQQARADFVEKWRKKPENQGSGKYPPPPRESEVEAMEMLDDMNDDRRSLTGYVCPEANCGYYETPDLERFQKHMRVRHGKDVTAEELAAATAPEPEPEDDDQRPAARAGKGSGKARR
jgi:hypothetical protein